MNIKKGDNLSLVAMLMGAIKKGGPTQKVNSVPDIWTVGNREENHSEKPPLHREALLSFLGGLGGVDPMMMAECLNKEREEEDIKKKKKLISGKCANPDESDIQLAVKYPHERLDERHVMERVFDKLPFNLLVAGELENIVRLEEGAEKGARLQIIKTICYHKNYLTDQDLRQGYDDTLKKVERGQEKWSMLLAEDLHK